MASNFIFSMLNVFISRTFYLDKLALEDGSRSKKNVLSFAKKSLNVIHNGHLTALHLCRLLCLLVMDLGEAWARCYLGFPTHRPLCDC